MGTFLLLDNCVSLYNTTEPTAQETNNIFISHAVYIAYVLLQQIILNGALHKASRVLGHCQSLLMISQNHNLHWLINILDNYQRYIKRGINM